MLANPLYKYVEVIKDKEVEREVWKAVPIFYWGLEALITLTEKRLFNVLLVLDVGPNVHQLSHLLVILFILLETQSQPIA